MSALPFIPHYRIEDYLRWEGDWELWNGVPVSMSPSPNFRHQQVARKILLEMSRQLEEGPCEGSCQCLYEIDWHVDDSTVVRPNILVICEEPEGEWIDDAPVLVVEVLSRSTREKDLTAKKELYGKEGVRYYLIADPEESEVTILANSESGLREIGTDTELEISDDCSLRILPEVFFRD